MGRRPDRDTVLKTRREGLGVVGQTMRPSPSFQVVEVVDTRVETVATSERVAMAEVLIISRRRHPQTGS